MPFSHHSHSGQFCPGHARNTLEEMLQTAMSKGMQLFALTEHMPRHDEDRYPEEIEMGTNLDNYIASHAEYFREATRLRQKYESRIDVSIGFECEWIRPESLDLIEQSLQAHHFDFFIGSVHHVHTIPIDYEQGDYLRARNVAGGSDERLFEDYFDAQYHLLQAVRPPVIGHFDLIRLKSDNPNGKLQQWSGVWQRILRNLDFIVAYGGILEINAASLRKGMSEPYPTADICKVGEPGIVHPSLELTPGSKVFLHKGGRFCLSDDSHGTDQVALHYHRLLDFVLDRVGIRELYFLTHSKQELDQPEDRRFPFTKFEVINADNFNSHSFWRRNQLEG